ncbi:UDP-phosphate alpha-N-acetyl-D-fucosaminephosphotransferase [Leucobacter triazinivorans]|uniref:UDP-phosphate alpha-N-acetyl-D-fucosaminephosphotransferase n=2 Tax=Leucobacter triazinivorans TaxID=1784719 RepID=A0A4P6KIJ6_9MICO|nr:UDP-phosphate alpha-N-acetyl-D-fucosaminephosphotransferase [Leucobacter triazinivorans]
MDVPNERSSHAQPVLRGLGLAVLIAMACGGGLATVLTIVSSPAQPGWPFLLTIGAGSLAAGLLGLREDLKGLSVPVRSGILLGIAALSSIALLWIARSGSGGAGLAWQLGIDVTGAPWWALILLALYGILFISSYINVANFMDGLNGISGLHGVIAGGTFAAAGWLFGASWLFVAGVVLAAGFAGFLPWNLSRPGAFLGDVGSYLLGGATAIISFAAFADGVPLLAAIGPMVIPFGDVGVTLVKRVRAGRRWDEPHKEHTYQRIQQMGYSHVQASGMAACATLLASVLGLASLFTGLLGTLALLAGGIAVLGLYLLLPRILPTRA